MPDDVHSLDAAREAVDLANAYGGSLDRSQEITLETCMAETESGLWAAATFGDCEPRQNGKGDSIQWRELYGATQRAERIAHTAHETGTALQAFQRMESLFQANADLRKLLRAQNPIRYSNGEWGIFFRSGAFIIYRTRTGSGLRGWDEIDLLVVDEAQHAQEEHMAATAPTQSVSANPQTYYAGSGGLSSSIVWWRLREHAIRDLRGPFGWCEHTSEQVSVDARNRIVSVAPDPEDESAWAMANPAYGYRIGGGGAGSRRYVKAELGKLGPALFLRERCGVWDPLPRPDAPDPKLDQDAWERTRSRRHVDVVPGACTLAFDVHLGWSTISIQTGTLADSWGAVVDHFKGTAALPERLVYFAGKYRPTAIGLDKGNGESFGELGAVLELFEAEGLDTDVIKPLSSEAVKAACQAVVSAVDHGQARRPFVEPDQLQSAGEVASWREVGNAGLFDRKAASLPLSPLFSWLIARSLLPTKAAEAPFWMLSAR